MKNEKIMAAFVMSLFALSAAGVVYAHWSDMVTIEATVEMGELIVGILSTDDPDNRSAFLWVYETTNGVPEEDFFPDKPWVANTTVTLDDFETSTHHAPKQTVAKKMIIYVDNAYPQYDVHVKFLLKNAGTIPAILPTGVKFWGEDVKDTEDLVFRYDQYSWALGVKEARMCYVLRGAFVDPVAGDIINVYMEIYTTEDSQLEPCTEYPVYMDIDFKQEAEECHTYKLYGEIFAVQWNKALEFGWKPP